MKPIVFVDSILNNVYDDGSFWAAIKDKFKISCENEWFIKDLSLKITNVKIPANFNKKAYIKNISRASKVAGEKDIRLAPKTYRCFDYELYTDFQKQLLGYSITESIKLMLRLKNKSIKNSCIVVYDAADIINKSIIYELSKEAKYIILFSNKITDIKRIQEYVTALYGVTPVITQDSTFALNSADFMVCSRQITVKNIPVWYIDNAYIPQSIRNNIINDVTFSTPWSVGNVPMTPEILGAILGQMEEKNVEKSLQYNGVHIDEIRFNDLVL